MKKIRYSGYRFPPEIIQQAIWLHQSRYGAQGTGEARLLAPVQSQGRRGLKASGGGSNGARMRLWKIELQKLADETALTLKRALLSAGNVEVEQDRAPPVLPYHTELARPASDGSYRRRRTHRRDDDKGGPQGRMRARRTNL
jgi:hypothetical protein